MKSQQIHWTLSPFEQRAFAGFFSVGFPKGVRRMTYALFRGVPSKSFLDYDMDYKHDIL